MQASKIIRRLLALLLLGSLCIAPVLAENEEETVQDNETAVYTYLTEEMGLSTAAACGVLANIEYESEFDPTVWGDGGASHGLCQWYSSRCEALSWFCEENGYDEDSVLGQMAYLQYELEESYSYVLEYIQSVEDSPAGAYDAAWYWCCHFEIPEDTRYQASLRGSLAEETYYPAYAQTEG